MIHRGILALLLADSLLAMCLAEEPSAKPSGNSSPGQTAFQRFIESNCFDCHDKTTSTAGLALDDLSAEVVGNNADAWEKVVRKLTTRQMPPRTSKRPEEHEYDTAIMWLESSLDAAATARPNPGRTDTFRRLNRTEYKNTIRTRCYGARFNGQELVRIPFGTTITYAQLAQRVGKPTASRAVGHANGRNPISIIVPCHRVVGADGKLTGYAGGVDKKQWLLAWERYATAPEPDYLFDAAGMLPKVCRTDARNRSGGRPVPSSSLRTSSRHFDC